MAANKLSNILRPMHNIPQQTRYLSKPVPISSTFLKGPPAKPITVQPIPFAASSVPEYDGATAVILDNVLSPLECQQLLHLAESSVSLDEEHASPWRPALVNMGVGWEVAIADYRNSDRIIWDEQTIVDRLWDRCLQADGIEEMFSKTPEDNDELMGRWVFERVNERMRFLKYTPGHFFKPHCDGSYGYEKDGAEIRTHYTVHLYLNDSAKESPTGEGHLGGATSFLSRNEKRRHDVNPKAGSVLIFQHKRLYHEGAEVTSGVKYTMRTDILYRWKSRK
ncbi:hypothetical protein QQS21_005721 [Conoideocrella luteorostrata]|uniref:Prolyl 4-hydroxylase alpha subunit domain-containing protein n=1 Tax=Conoideocrella luteorostrata TaxID=1105319 RepID=A0AAJ0CT87_9HYPO|nr:hypothetical protein QQS21_005721 [Conoideocrella luteorostrata]